ncbi:MAG: MFS transporter [Planctomycetota bacterium]|jgi:ACS family hexuronate transporter-like MFS transporter|nr:MAG: MFS transporter [Planctomycetota bacterium]
MPAIASRPTNVRWLICALLFFAAAINYIDRQVIGILKPTLQEQFHFDEQDYAAIVFTFQAAYAIGLLLSGRIMDRIGVRRGFALAVVVWSIGAVMHGAADWLPWLRIPTLSIDPPAVVFLGGATAGLALSRLVLGLGEAGNFPASIKAVAEWFPKKERALATGIFNSGTNIGALVTPLVVPWITLAYGWQWAFVITGVLGFGWVIWWFVSYRDPEMHPGVNAAELAIIQSDPVEKTAAIPWSRLLPHRQTWAFAAGKFLTDPIWWLYLFWVPDFLKRNHGLDLKTMGLPLVVIYLVADVGSIGGGWLSSHLIKRGWSTNAARKTAMLVCALAVVPMLAAAQVKSLWMAVALVSIAAAAHQGWSANLFTLVSDMFPKRAVGSVVGIGGMAGSVGGMLIALVVGAILQKTGSYVPIFVMAASAYLVALVIIQLLVPQLAPADLDTDPTT